MAKTNDQRLVVRQKRLVLGCLRLAWKLAWRYRSRWSPLLSPEEAESFAVWQLCKAARSYKAGTPSPTNGQPANFGTYATICISRQFRCGFQEGSSLVHVPLNLRCAGMLPPRVDLFGAMRAVADGCNELDGAEIIEDPHRAPDGLEKAEDETTQTERLVSVLSLLNEREADVLRRRFGLAPYPEKGQTLAAVGAAYGVTKERARQIEAVALEKLRRAVGASNPIEEIR